MSGQVSITRQISMENNAETDPEIVLRSGVEFERIAAFEPDRIVVDLENSDVNSWVDLYVEAAAENHREAVF